MSSVLTLVNSVIVVDHSEQGFDVSEHSFDVNEHCSVLILSNGHWFLLTLVNSVLI